jgi:hypothetical protein
MKVFYTCRYASLFDNTETSNSVAGAHSEESILSKYIFSNKEFGLSLGKRS